MLRPIGHTAKKVEKRSMEAEKAPSFLACTLCALTNKAS
jgi:hypothetical protein